MENKEHSLRDSLETIMTQFNGRDEIEVIEILANVVGNTIGQLQGDRGKALAFLMMTAMEIIKLHLADEPDEDDLLH